jgi:hypothetical protein
MADKDIIAELTGDHREVEELFGRIQATLGGDPERKRLMEQVTIELVRHSVAEEQYLYPAVREHLASGNTVADKEIADHAAVEETLNGSLLTQGVEVQGLSRRPHMTNQRLGEWPTRLGGADVPDAHSPAHGRHRTCPAHRRPHRHPSSQDHTAHRRDAVPGDGAGGRGPRLRHLRGD